MRLTGKPRLLAVAPLLLLVAGCLPERGAAQTPVRRAVAECPIEPSLNVRGFPSESCDRNLSGFGNMAWETFKTLVWPAVRQQRGLWDTNRPITDMDGPRVFETYKADWETFQKDAEPPQPWVEYPKKAPVCANADTMAQLDGNSLVLASLHKFGNIDQRDVPIESDKPSIRHLLVARNGTPVRYLTGFSEMAFNSIVTKGLFRPIDVDPSFEAPDVRTAIEDGTITIKSAWIEMAGIADPGSFYTRDAWVQTPTDDHGVANCEQKRVGLVGLHIGHKTHENPQWIWASFEHVRNVPLRWTRPGTSPGTHYTFHDGTINADGTFKTMPEEPPLNARLPMRRFAIPPPYNVERVKAIPAAIREVNRVWREKLATTKPPSVWANYDLVVVQWPLSPQAPELTGLGRAVPGRNGDMLFGASPVPPCRGFEWESNLTSSVLETFLQPDTFCMDDLTCMSCHSRARSYDFVWSIPLAHKNPNGASAPSTNRRSALAILQEIVEQHGRAGRLGPARE